MGLFFYNKIGSIRSIGDLPTTNIIEPFFEKWALCLRINSLVIEENGEIWYNETIDF